MFEAVLKFVRETPGINIGSRGMRALGAMLKPLTPRSLNGRFVLIIIAPVILIQISATFLYMERYSQQVTERLASAVGGELALILAQLDDHDTMEDRQKLLQEVSRNMSLDIRIEPGATMPPPKPYPFFSFLPSIVDERVGFFTGKDVWFDPEVRPSMVQLQLRLDEGVMVVEMRRSRIMATNWHIFIVWMVVAAVLFVTIAIMFLRNQVRAILRLGLAAESFGKGRDVPNFKPSGAREVRRAATAVILMKQRINAHITQRTEMLAGVSHDLRTPITRMKLQLAMMEETDDVRDMKSDLAEMEHMLDEYLAFARGQGGEETSLTNLSDLLIEIVSDAKRQKQQIDLDCPLAFEMPMKRMAMKRAIANLVGNARHHAKTTKLTARQIGKGIEVTVEDDGPGIPEHRREEAFRPFHRLDEGRNLEEGGSGLGLAIAQDIIRAHGGDIRLGDSDLGGLKVTVTLPG